MPPRRRYGRDAHSAYQRPADASKPYPGMLEKWEREYYPPIFKICTDLRLDLIFHDPDSRDVRKVTGKNTWANGFPDLWIVGRRRLFVRELKRDSDGDVTDAQRKWLDGLKAVGIDAGVWWLPRDLNSGRVQTDLNDIARHGPQVPDLVDGTAKLMFLATHGADRIPGAALHWDAGTQRMPDGSPINRALWRAEARLLLHRAASALPVGDVEIRQWLRQHQMPEDATPQQVLQAVRMTFTRHEELS